jgi:hypothetical protein
VRDFWQASWIISAEPIAGVRPMTAVGDAGAVVGVVANPFAVSADPRRSTKRTAMARTTSGLRATHTPVSSLSPDSLSFQEAAHLDPEGLLGSPSGRISGVAKVTSSGLGFGVSVIAA